MSAPQDDFQDDGTIPSQNDYESRTGQKDQVPVLKDDAGVEDPIDPNVADSDQLLAERDDADAIDESNIIEERTRGAVKSYTEPGDDEGLPGPEDGTSRVSGGPN